MQKTIKFLNPENAIESEVAVWKIREASRGIVIDSSGKIGLLLVAKSNYYKLPGGGIDDGETKEEGFKRECLEEIGCNVEILKELGKVEEWRKIFGLKQISHCYVAKVVGEKKAPNFTEHEMQNNFEVAWVSQDELLGKIQNSKPSNFEGENYIQPRDVAIVEEFLKQITK